MGVTKDYRDKRDYELMAYCIIPNHVHMVFDHGGVDERGSVRRPTGFTRILENLCKPNLL